MDTRLKVGHDKGEEEGTLRLGFRVISGFREEWAAAIAAQRPKDFAALARLPVPRAALEALAEADALRSLGLDRRAALWQVRGVPDSPPLPLFAPLEHITRPVDLPVMAQGEHVIADYRSTGLSLKSHPLRFLRPRLAAEAVLSCAEACGRKEGARVALAGVVLVRQRPGGGEVVFITIEDETGIANIVVWASLLEKYRRAVVASRILQVRGRVQRSAEGVVHIIADALENRSELIGEIADAEPARATTPRHARAQRLVDALPGSRDFH